MTTAESAQNQGVKLVRWTGLAMMLPAVIAVALLAKDAAIVVDNINQTALKQQAESIDRGLKLLGELHATEILSQTLWDQAFRNVVLKPKKDWIRKNFGKDVLPTGAVQQLAIVNAAGKVIFSSDYEKAPPAAEAAELLAVAKAPMERARALYREAHAADEGFGERQPGAMTDGIYVSDLIRIGGKPAMVTVSPFAPDVEDLRAPVEPTLLVGIQLMTTTLLTKLEQLSHVEGIRHAAPDQTDTHLHPIRSAGGEVVANLTWNYAPPGHAILRAATPAIAGSLMLITLLTTVTAITMRRMARRLAVSEQAAVYASRHDAATGLANRGWFMRVFEDLLEPASKAPASRAVMLIDCDYFKSVNDTLGHAAGDAVIAAIAQRLQSLSAKSAIAARLGGDEFALVTTPLAKPADIHEAMRQVHETLTKPVLFESHLIAVSVSIGVTLIDTPTSDPVDLWLAKTDTALYRAKRDGRGCARLYDPALDRPELPMNANLRKPDNDGGPARHQAA